MKDLLAWCVVLCSTAFQAAADEWISGSPKVINGHTLSIAGDQVMLDGILPIKSTSKCKVGKARLPCNSLATAELGRMVSNQTVICSISAEDGRGNLIGRCIVNELDLAAELARLGLAEAATSAETRTVIEQAKGVEFTTPTPRGGPEAPLNETAEPVADLQEPAPRTPELPEPLTSPEPPETSKNPPATSRRSITPTM